MKTRRTAYTDKQGLADYRTHAHNGVFVDWNDSWTDVVDDSTGCVLYSRNTNARALENAIAWCRRHQCTIKRVIVAPRALTHVPRRPLGAVTPLPALMRVLQGGLS